METTQTPSEFELVDILPNPEKYFDFVSNKKELNEIEIHFLQEIVKQSFIKDIELVNKIDKLLSKQKLDENTTMQWFYNKFDKYLEFGAFDIIYKMLILSLSFKSDFFLEKSKIFLEDFILEKEDAKYIEILNIRNMIDASKKGRNMPLVSAISIFENIKTKKSRIQKLYDNRYDMAYCILKNNSELILDVLKFLEKEDKNEDLLKARIYGFYIKYSLNNKDFELGSTYINKLCKLEISKDVDVFSIISEFIIYFEKFKNPELDAKIQELYSVSANFILDTPAEVVIKTRKYIKQFNSLTGHARIPVIKEMKEFISKWENSEIKHQTEYIVTLKQLLGL